MSYIHAKTKAVGLINFLAGQPGRSRASTSYSLSCAEPFQEALKMLTELGAVTGMIVGAFTVISYLRSHSLNASIRHERHCSEMCQIAKEHESSTNQKPIKDHLANLLALQWRKPISPHCFIHLYKNRLLGKGFRHLTVAAKLVTYSRKEQKIVDLDGSYKRYQDWFRQSFIAYLAGSAQFIVVFTGQVLLNVDRSTPEMILMQLGSFSIFAVSAGISTFVTQRFHALYFLINERPFLFRVRSLFATP